MAAALSHISYECFPPIIVNSLPTELSLFGCVFYVSHVWLPQIATHTDMTDSVESDLGSDWEPWNEKVLETWIPPAWWAVNGDAKSPEDYEKIRIAYAKADDCAICKDLRESKFDMSFKLSSLWLSTQDGCAGCLLLLHILHTCGSIEPHTSWTSDGRVPLRCKMNVSEMIVMDTWRSSFEVYTLPNISGMCSYTVIDPY